MINVETRYQIGQNVKFKNQICRIAYIDLLVGKNKSEIYYELTDGNFWDCRAREHEIKPIPAPHTDAQTIISYDEGVSDEEEITWAIGDTNISYCPEDRIWEVDSFKGGIWKNYTMKTWDGALSLACEIEEDYKHV